jgi:spore coat protein CotH
LRSSDRRASAFLYSKVTLRTNLILVLLFFASVTKGLASEELFERSSASKISIELGGTNFTALKDVTQQGNPKVYVRAKVTEGESVYEDVGLRLKGNSSFRSLMDKPSITLKFDEFTKGQRFHGLAKIHLDNSISDKSFLTMILCAELFNAAGVPTPRGTYADVAINGIKRGVYVLNEGFDKSFLKLHFPRPRATFMKLRPRRILLKSFAKLLAMNQTIRRLRSWLQQLVNRTSIRDSNC